MNYLYTVAFIIATIPFVVFGYPPTDANIYQSHPRYGNITVEEKMICSEETSNNLSWLRFKNFLQCINVVADFDVPACLFRQIEQINMTYQRKDLNYMLNSKVYVDEQKISSCSTYMVFTKNLTFIKNLFKNGQKHFYPFTNIYLFLPKTMYVSQTSILIALNNGYNIYTVRNRIFSQTTPYFNLNYQYLTNLYTNKTLDTSERDVKKISKYFGTLIAHPLFDKSITKNRPFRVAMFNCPPYVMVLNAAKKLFDGVEYRFIRESTRDWKVEYNLVNSSWRGALGRLNNDTSDIAICSVWLSLDHMKRFDLSTVVDHQCLTLLVPRPTRLDEATFIFLSLEPPLWGFFGVAFIVVAFVLTGFSKLAIFLKIYKPKALVYRSLPRAFVDVVNTATRHGLSNFPMQTPFKFIIISWIILCLLFDVIYSSGYVSILTSPPYSKPIDTINDFLNHKLSWGELHNVSDIRKSLRKYDLAAYQKVADNVVKESSQEERARNIYSGKFAYLTKKIANKYITEIPLRNISARTPLRLMNSCIIHYFSVLAFSLKSPYRDFFSYKLARFHQMGILKLWFNDIARNESETMKYYLNPSKPDDEFKPMTIKDVSGAFYLLAVGLTLSLFAFAFEICVYSMRLRKRKKHVRQLQIRK